jgi:hypothetical protein
VAWPILHKLASGLDQAHRDRARSLMGEHVLPSILAPGCLLGRGAFLFSQPARHQEVANVPASGLGQALRFQVARPLAAGPAACASPPRRAVDRTRPATLPWPGFFLPGRVPAGRGGNKTAASMFSGCNTPFLCRSIATGLFFYRRFNRSVGDRARCPVQKS